MKDKKVFTKGGLNILELKIGDVVYEYYYRQCLESKVLTLPTETNGLWQFKTITEDGTEIDYGVHEDYQYYAPNLYNYKAYF